MQNALLGLIQPLDRGLHAYRTACVRSGYGPVALAGSPLMCEAISGSTAIANFLLSGSVFVHGLRPIDLPGEPAGHRVLSAGSSRQALPPGNSRHRLAYDLGLCERATGLASLCRLRPTADCRGSGNFMARTQLLPTSRRRFTRWILRPSTSAWNFSRGQSSAGQRRL